MSDATLLREGIDTMLAGDINTGKAILRDYIKATIGFEKLEPLHPDWVSAEAGRPGGRVSFAGGRESGFSRERRWVHPAARANSSKNAMS